MTIDSDPVLGGDAVDAEAAARRRRQRMAKARGSRVALLAIDLQNDFCHPDGLFGRAGAKAGENAPLIERVNALARAARAAGHLVVWVRTAWTPDDGPGLLEEHSPLPIGSHLQEGTWGAELLDGLFPDPDDRILRKSRFSAFFRTELEEMLGDEGVAAVVVAGVRTDFCVESTVRDAFFRDLEVFVVGDAVQGYVPELHDHSLREMNTVFAEVVRQADAIELLGHEAIAGEQERRAASHG